jgi:hypothetical protein
MYRSWTAGVLAESSEWKKLARRQDRRSWTGGMERAREELELQEL